MTGIRVAGACALVAAAFGAGTAPAYGQATAAPEKIHVEARLMFWADASGRESLPDQQDTITDFFVRRARLVLQGRVTEDLTLSFQLGSDHIGSARRSRAGAVAGRIPPGGLGDRPRSARAVDLPQHRRCDVFPEEPRPQGAGGFHPQGRNPRDRQRRVPPVRDSRVLGRPPCIESFTRSRSPR